MTQRSKSDITAGDVHRAVYCALTDLGITPASAAYATGRAVQALLEPQLTFELDREYARRAKRAPKPEDPL